MRFSDACLAQLKGTARIVDWIDGVAGLKKNGREFTCRCTSPDHNDRKPSMAIIPADNFAYCFSCGYHADVIQFVMDTRGLGFTDAVLELGDHYGIRMEADDPEADRKFHQEQAKRKALLEKKAAQIETWKAALMDHGPVTYLMDRGFDFETIDAWDVGWDGQRLQFPIWDHAGQVIGHTGRWPGTPQGAAPKWKHCREDLVFKQGRVLFGLNRALPHIRKAGHVVIVEGHGDVVMCHQRGHTNVVGGVGTGFTDDQVQLLLQMGITSWVFALDGDDAGRKAMVRHIHKLRQKLIGDGITLKVAQLPEGADPGDTDLAPLVAKAIPWWDFLFSWAARDYDASDLEQVQLTEGRIEKLLESMPAGSVFTRLRQRAESELNYNAAAEPAEEVLSAAERRVEMAERRALRLALHFPGTRPAVESLPIGDASNLLIRDTLFSLADLVSCEQLPALMWKLGQKRTDLRCRLQKLIKPNADAWEVVKADPVREMAAVSEILLAAGCTTSHNGSVA